MLSLPQADRDFFAALRRREFGRLDEEGIVYLDTTGGALYGASQLEAQRALLGRHTFGNPHSEHRPSRRATAAIQAARATVLGFLDADPATHAVVFTANATAAIKLVAESYRFAGRRCLLSADNHNSINGLGEYAGRAGARLDRLPLDRSLRLAHLDAVPRSATPGLFAFPAQSNFSGVLHPLALAERAKERGFDVLLDAASFAGSHRLSLRDCPADFVALSFYKLFGLPTGLGALVARRAALARLERPWFAGGTVLYASVDPPAHRLRPDETGFEDGTPNFLGIATLESGFALLAEIGIERLERHVLALTGAFLEALLALRHTDGAPLARIHGPRTTEGRGATVAFNLLARDGSVVPYWEVESWARRFGVALRGGCFCNPGAAQAALGLDGGRSARCFTALGSDFTAERFATCLGEPVGALRVSFGAGNVDYDVDAALAMLEAFAEASAVRKPWGSSGVTTRRSSSPASTSTAFDRSLA